MQTNMQSNIQWMAFPFQGYDHQYNNMRSIVQRNIGLPQWTKAIARDSSIERVYILQLVLYSHKRNEIEPTIIYWTISKKQHKTSYSNGLKRTYI